MITAKVKMNPNSDTMKKIAAKLKQLAATKIKFGYFEDSGKHTQANRNGDTILYATLMAWHELGISGMYVARPLLTIGYFQTIDLFKSGKYNDIVKRIIVNNSTKDLNQLGAAIRDDIKEIFGSELLEANTEVTESIKGFNAPLIESGELHDNFGYKINDEGVVK